MIAGLGAIVFQFLCHFVLQYGLAGITGFAPTMPAGEAALQAPAGEFVPWLIVAVMVGGGLLSGWLVYTFAPEAEGHGTDAAIDSFHNRRGEMRARVPLIKMLASAATIGTGGSGGREGPIAQIGAGFGSYLATRLKLSARDRRVLLAVGMGAGVGAIFRAPLAGALFAS
jgi:CIC family chloride channel protein